MSDYGFHFAGLYWSQPLWLLLLIPLGMAAWYTVRRRRQPAILYSSVDLLGQLPRTWALRVKRLLPWTRIVAMVLIALALARPQRGEEQSRVQTEGIAIQMCLDCSGSMAERDFQIEGEWVNRIEAVKGVFRDFVSGTGELPGRRDDRIGLIAFGGYAIDKCPLTLDHGALLDVLETVKIPPSLKDEQGRLHPLLEGLTREQLSQLARQGILQRLEERQATAIGDAVSRAVDQLKEVDSRSKVIILLSDGRQTAGVVAPEKAAEAARAKGVKVYTIGVGRTAADMTVREDFFSLQVLARGRGSELDEATLKMIGEKTGGKYFHAKDTETLAEVYAEIDRMEKTETQQQRFTRYRERYGGWLFAAVGLLLLEVSLVSTRFRTLP